eukprot:7956159-Lingulodinium_polyedra.AAC.1
MGAASRARGGAYAASALDSRTPHNRGLRRSRHQRAASARQRCGGRRARGAAIARAAPRERRQYRAA